MRTKARILAKPTPEQLYHLRNGPHQILNTAEKHEDADGLRARWDRLSDLLRQNSGFGSDGLNDGRNELPNSIKAIRRKLTSIWADDLRAATRIRGISERGLVGLFVAVKAKCHVALPREHR